MNIEVIDVPFTICKLSDTKDLDMSRRMHFAAFTDNELSLVCPTADVPSSTVERNDGWRAFRISGTLDFSLIGILSRISKILADGGIGIFAISTYDTDYILVKEGNLNKAVSLLQNNGYTVV